MNVYLVIAADAARARFFHLQQTDLPELESGPNLVEDDVYVNPENTMAEGDVFAGSKDGRNRTRRSEMHGYDDHRSQHVTEFERRFAQNIAKEAVVRAKNSGARIVVVAANPRMLGLLRPELERANQGRLEVREFGRDVSKLGPIDLHKHLAKDDILPVRKRPDANWPGTR